MNLYNLHKDPKSLHKHEQAHDVVPALIAQQFEDPDFSPTKTQTEAILKSPYLSYEYAVEVLDNSRFLPGEKAIATSPKYALRYALVVLKKRFRLGEKAIASSAMTAVDYAIHVIKGEWLPGENAIATSHAHSMRYALHAIKDKWPLGEKIMSTNVYTTTKYNQMLRDKGYSEDDLI